MSSLKERIIKVITENLNPTHFEITDTTVNHASGHPDKRAHFSLEIQSAKFENMSMIQQHRLVYDLLNDELNNGLHALSLKTSY